MYLKLWVGVGVFGLAWVAGCGSRPYWPDVQALTGDVVAGEASYRSRCAGCHGSDGEGIIGPAMTSLVPGMLAEDFYKALYTTRDMPSFKLEDQEGADLMAYLDETYGPFPETLDALSPTGDTAWITDL